VPSPPHPDHDDASAVGTSVTGLALDDGLFVVYDPNEEDAWLQSDTPTVLADRQ